MDFRKMSLKSILSVLFLGVLFIGLLIWKCSSQVDVSAAENIEALPVSQNAVVKENNEPAAGISKEEEAQIQEQLDRDRRQQKQTKDLRIKLEQTNLELEQEKALAEIYKLKNENTGIFKESIIDGQKDLPDIKVEYIGGDSLKKEAILSIAGTNYQVKEKSSPMDNIKVVSISDSSVTLHFRAPQELTKIIDYKPE